MIENQHTIIAMLVGNTNTLAGLYDLRNPGKISSDLHRIANQDAADAARAIAALDEDAPIVVASVNDPWTDQLVTALEAAGRRTLRIGHEIGINMNHRVDDEQRTGIDRFLAARGAYQVFQQACVIVDAGTAVTVDFIDGEGTFEGGAIAPGARMSLAALAERTAALPEIELRPPESDPFGRNTAQAILNGIVYGIRGLVRVLTERYAEAFEAYPLIVATGGDAALIFKDDELIERIVPDLALIGVAVSMRDALEAEDAEVKE